MRFSRYNSTIDRTTQKMENSMDTLGNNIMNKNKPIDQNGYSSQRYAMSQTNFNQSISQPFRTNLLPSL